uniref:SH3 domain-containing GRB2-like protein n=1 Tax=Haemonchus contortus TaxID=6289 RepID=A0A7I4YP22_HAECO|nr:BAR and Src homology-3 domain containing protein [Haemonchus contortus]
MSAGISMADLFNKHIKKATSRTKEKLLEGIGKAKATQDETFDNHAANLVKQSKSCERLFKDVKAYSTAMKALCQAEKALHDTIRESYEPEWPEREQLTALLDNLEIQSNEMEKVLCEDLPQTVYNYVSQFPELKKKVDKRGRKLVDYDHAKHTYSSAKASSKKGETDPKVAKAYTELQQAEAFYKEINNELLEILPATYDSRITFYVDTLQSLFNSRSIYQTECSKLNKQIVSQLDRLGESMDFLRVPRPEPRPSTPTDSAADGGSHRSTPSPAPAPPPATPASLADSASGQMPPANNPFDEDNVEETFEQKIYPKLAAAPPRAEKDNDKVEKNYSKKEKDTKNPFDEDTDDEHPAVVPEEAPPTEHALEGVTKEARKVLYLVKATHEYKAVDTDELSFSPGETLKVLESKPEDQVDEGWQLGEKSDGTRGVFPENFTRKLE